MVGMTQDPYFQHVAMADLSRLAAAMQLVAHRADLGARQRLVDDSQHQLAAEQIRLTQARGIAKKLMVIVNACGDDLRGKLTDVEERTLDDGLSQATELVFDR